MTENEKKIEKKTDDPNPKTPYTRPQLVVYGDIRDITLTKQKGGAPDNPGQDRTMTGFEGTPKDQK
jgi:hypothetical protein